MDIVLSNYKKQIPEFLEHLKTCDFVAFDLEMTGIHISDPADKFDLPFEKYIKVSPKTPKSHPQPPFKSPYTYLKPSQSAQREKTG